MPGAASDSEVGLSDFSCPTVALDAVVRVVERELEQGYGIDIGYDANHPASVGRTWIAESRAKAGIVNRAPRRLCEGHCAAVTQG
jgi:hypothetical protein